MSDSNSKTSTINYDDGVSSEQDPVVLKKTGTHSTASTSIDYLGQDQTDDVLSPSPKKTKTQHEALRHLDQSSSSSTAQQAFSKTFTYSNINFDDKALSQNSTISFETIELMFATKAEQLEKSLFKKQQDAIGTVEESQNAALADIDNHKTETKEELKETRNSVLGTIALFAAFFTFVSVNVNIFTKAENVIQSIIFMLSFWLCIIGFIVLFFFFLNKEKGTNILKSVEFYTLISCVLLSSVLMFFLFKSKNQESYQKINARIEKIEKESKSLKDENSKLNDILKKQLESHDNQIFELRKNQYQLNN